MFLTGLIFGASVVYLICQGEQFFDQEISFQMTLGLYKFYFLKMICFF